MPDFVLTNRVKRLKQNIHSKKRYASIEQAKIITDIYKQNEDKPRIIQRALALSAAMNTLEIAINPDELIVGNRTAGVRYGVVFPESGSTWVDKEFETLPTRPQDPFEINQSDVAVFRNEIKPYWQGKSLEDMLVKRYGKQIKKIEPVVKINQKDHAQGHICPDCKTWLAQGPAGLRRQAERALQSCKPAQNDFYTAVVIVMQGAEQLMLRYAALAKEMMQTQAQQSTKEDLQKVVDNCTHLSSEPPQTFHQAVQGLWFLFVILHMESNASSFSPGRLDKHLFAHYKQDIENGALNKQDALEILECLWVKFNEIVYMRNSHSAQFFAGFPIGFNVAIGGQNAQAGNYENDITFLCLQAQQHLGLPQPNLSVRLHKGTGDELLQKAVEVVSEGSGMPQFFNDEAVIPALESLGIQHEDALDYAIVGCVELTTQGNNLGWSDAAMFNLNKVLELTLTGGVDLLTSEKIAPNLGSLATYKTFEALEQAFETHIKQYISCMIKACEQVEQVHVSLLPTPFLSAVISNCMQSGVDVTKGGAKYNLSGIQMIQIANLADSLAAVKQLVFDEKRITGQQFLQALQNNFENNEVLRQLILNKVPKYGNDIDYVDELGVKYANYFKKQLAQYTNYRNGQYHTGMYTVSAHVPMGEMVGASADGRLAGTPLADGGMSPMYGRDLAGPTAVLKSVSKLDKSLTSNGGLLNMKFLPKFFETRSSIKKFAAFLRGFVDLEIPHIQFNVVNKQDLLAAQQNPEKYRGLTVRVAGYTAYFTELASTLQNEIIARTSYGGV